MIGIWLKLLSMLKNCFYFVILLAFCFSCQDKHEEIDLFVEEEIDFMEEEIVSEAFGLKSLHCLTATRLGRDNENCCAFEVCLDGPIPNGETIQVFQGRRLIHEFKHQLGFPGEQKNCFQFITCDDAVLRSRIKSSIPEQSCKLVLTCITQEECCESVCFKRSLISLFGECDIFTVSLDGNRECFPDGFELAGPLPDVDLIDFTVSNGTIEFLGVLNGSFGRPDRYRFEYCREGDINVEIEFSFTIRNHFCDSEDTFTFDLIDEGPFANECQ